MHIRLKITMGLMFSVVLLGISLLLTTLAVTQFVSGLLDGKELINLFVQSINTMIISLAVFELGIGIGQEYGVHEEETNHYAVVRRTITRFVGTVSIALVLEGLIMVIKYSQLELAGNLYYPVAILCGASVLLMGMGVFLHLSRGDCNTQPARTVTFAPAPVRPSRSDQNRPTGSHGRR